ncbi:CreA family protein [Pseudoalteromonas xiamenensis]|uniref:CreA family protein n=1 Tax=Pseudoalteromonas xiamenensis TaxID=882626 RepID=UPI0027E521FA|nr:CreA family protein [Pseudoalteromonas xiamenensis]WMN61117.1 CreA family protein [Pseudoalteromonas xiamenensis]
MRIFEKQMKSTFIVGALVLLSGCSDDAAKVSLGLFTTKDVIVSGWTDPKVTGVTCHVSHIEANLDFADPSDMSIACRQTGPITAEQMSQVKLGNSGEVVFSTSKSVLFKSLKVRRVYDPESKTLLYISYSTKETSGSHHHALSTVPLFGTDAWDWASSQVKK